MDGGSHLRADYSISCGTSLHMFFKVYAGLMVLVSKGLGRLSCLSIRRLHAAYGTDKTVYFMHYVYLCSFPDFGCI